MQGIEMQDIEGNRAHQYRIAIAPSAGSSLENAPEILGSGGWT